MLLAFKLLRVGVSQAKKHNDKKKARQNQSPPQGAWPSSNAAYPQPQPQHHPYPPQTYQPYPPDRTQDQQQGQQQPPNMHIPMPPTFSSDPTPSAPEADTDYYTGDERSPLKKITEPALRTLQFILSLTVIGLYGHDIQPTADSSDPRWVYAVVVGFLGALTAFVYVLCDLVVLRNRPLRTRPVARFGGMVWEGVLVVNWLVVFGIFAGVFLGDNSDGDDNEGKGRMWNAV
ncbi:hypothetical protein PHISP_06401, partial [Aspergillus sp. HF37]